MNDSARPTGEPRRPSRWWLAGQVALGAVAAVALAVFATFWYFRISAWAGLLAVTMAVALIALLLRRDRRVVALGFLATYLLLGLATEGSCLGFKEVLAS